MSRELVANISGTGNTSRNYGAITNVSDPDVGFSPTELYNLSENISTNVYTVNKNWRSLEKAFKLLGTFNDNQELRDKIHVTQISTNQIIGVTSKDLKRLTAIVKRGDKQQRLQVEKLTNDFSDAVSRYSQIQKKVADRMKANLLLINIEEPHYSTGENKFEERGQILAQKQLETKELNFEQGMLIERDERIRQIEADIIDINQFMRELGALVYQQTESLDTIENGIETAAGGIEQGTEEILKAASYQRKYRRKLIIILLVAAVITIILIWVIISTFKSNK